MAMSLVGKTAIVTGAGSGINLSFARALLGKHCNVVFADLALRPEAQELVSNHANTSRKPAKAVFQPTDVREWQQLERLFCIASEEFGGADIVCPGAGVYEPPWSNFWHPPGYPLSKDDPTSNHYANLDINLTHPIRTTQLALSHFLSCPSPSPSTFKNPQSRSPKSIIHISSIAGQLTPFHAPIYTATKHALNGFIRSLAPLDKRLGVRVTAVAPGVIKTPLWTEHPEKLKLVAEDDEWVAPEFVADVMVSLVEGGVVSLSKGLAMRGGSRLRSGDEREGVRQVAVGGGMILEVAKGRVRVVEQFNDAGPSGEGNTLGNIGEAEEEIFASLQGRGGGWGVD